MPRSYKLVGLVLVSLALVSAAVVATVRVSAAHAADAPFVINMAVAPSTVDPAEACGLSDLTIVDNVYSRLTRYGSKAGPGGTTQVDPAKILPDLASSWTISKNGRVYTFKLRAGVTFPNGDPVDSAAVKYSLQRTVTMAGCGEYLVLDGFETPSLISSIATPTPTTVVITLTQADPNALQDWAQAAASIVDPKIVDANGGVQPGKINTWMAGHVAGDGPYLLESYSPNSQAVLVANPKFYRQPASKKVVINFIPSDPTLLLDARSGAADVTIGMTGQSVHSLVGKTNVRIIANNTTTSEQIGLVNNHPPFDNVKLREALTYAVPYSPILQKIALGYGQLYYGPLPPAFPTYNATLEQRVKFDLTKARQLVAASGVKMPITVRLAMQAGNPIQQQIATVVQSTWKDLGVTVVVVPLAASAYSNAVETHQVDAYMRDSGPGVIDAGYYLGYDMKCGIPQNLIAMCIPKADKLLDTMRQTTDPKQRQALLNQIMTLWRNDWPKIQVYADQTTTVLNKDVKTFFYSHELDFTTWSK